MIRKGTRFIEAAWDDAMNLITSVYKELLQSKSHAFYTSGQLMLEKYYTLSVIGKTALGRSIPSSFHTAGQAANGARDQELIQTVEQCATQTEAQQHWLATRA